MIIVSRRGRAGRRGDHATADLTVAKATRRKRATRGVRAGDGVRHGPGAGGCYRCVRIGVGHRGRREPGHGNRRTVGGVARTAARARAPRSAGAARFTGSPRTVGATFATAVGATRRGRHDRRRGTQEDGQGQTTNCDPRRNVSRAPGSQVRRHRSWQLHSVPPAALNRGKSREVRSTYQQISDNSLPILRQISPNSQETERDSAPSRRRPAPSGQVGSGGS